MTVPTQALSRWRQVRQAELRAQGEPDRGSVSLPEPVQRAVEVELTDPRVPDGARWFAKAAIRQGWVVRATYARGPLQTARGRTYKIVDSLMIQCRKTLGGAGAAINACWIDGKADTCGHVVAGQGRVVKISEGRRLLTCEEYSGPAVP